MKQYEYESINRRRELMLFWLVVYCIMFRSENHFDWLFIILRSESHAHRDIAIAKWGRYASILGASCKWEQEGALFSVTFRRPPNLAGPHDKQTVLRTCSVVDWPLQSHQMWTVILDLFTFPGNRKHIHQCLCHSIRSNSRKCDWSSRSSL